MENYHFGVECNWIDGERHFLLNLSKGNIDFLLQGCPELECISGRSKDVILRIYYSMDGGLPDKFVAMEDNEYYAHLGVFLDRSVRERSNEQIESDLVNAINASDEIPLIMMTGGKLRKICVGYALMRVV